LSQDNQGSDLSDLKSRLGLNNEDESESDGDEASEQAADADQQPAHQGKEASDAEGARYQAQQQGQGAGEQPARGGPPGQDPHEAETRVGPPPGEAGPPGQGGAGAGDQASSPPGGPGVGDQGSNPQRGGGVGNEPSNSFSETTPDDRGPGRDAFGPAGGGPPGSGGPPGGDRDPTGPTGGAGGGSNQPEIGGAQADPGPDADLEADEDLDLENSMFSTPVYVMLGVVLVVGLVFGLLIMSSYNQRRMYTLQTEQAQEVLKAVEPNVSDFEKAQSIIKNLNPEDVEYDQAAQLGELDLAVDMSVISTDKLFLGGERTAMLTSYIVKSEKLQQMIEEHARLTTEADREELEKIMGGEEEEQRDLQYAAAFNFNQYKNSITSEDYRPSTGKLIAIPDMEDIEDGKVKYTMPNSERGGRIDLRGVIPVSKGDMLTVGGENAFGRYQHRIKKMKHMVEQMTGRPKALVQKLDELAHRPAPPLISL